MIALRIADALLTNTTLVLENKRIKGASVFPFFSESGQVRQWMIVLPGSKTVFLVPSKKGLATVSIFGAVRLSIDSAELKSNSEFSLSHVRDLYHYDPNWVLSQERFAGYWAREAIIQSNCAPYIAEKVRQLLFSRDLCRLESLVMRAGFLNTFKTMAPETVLGRIPSAQPEKSDLSGQPVPVNSGWQLDPIWDGFGECRYRFF